MSVLHIPCPSCQKELKVKDPSLLGRKAKCPACEHRFVLRWDPADDDAPVASEDPARRSSEKKKTGTGAQPAVAAAPDPAIPQIAVSSGDGLGRLNELRERNRRRRNRTLMVAGVMLVLIVCGFFVARPYLPATSGESDQVAVTSQGGAQQTGSVPPISAQPPAVRDADWVEELSPTSGEPITLRMVPSGARLIINLRPAQLWSSDPRMAELRASLTQDVTGWIEAQLKAVCRHEPAQIEEVLLAWILGARGTEPQLAAVVHLVEDARMSDLLDEFGSEAIDELAQPKVYRKDDRATLILDPRTFATAPLEYGSELAQWIETPNFNTSDGIINLLEYTDRDRLVTVVCEPADLQLHLENLVSETARPVISQVAEWFAHEAETVAWSLHTGDEFHSEILVSGPRLTSPQTTEQNLRQRIEQVPPTMVELVRKMRPQRSGFRQIIGRFPAMLEVSRLATIFDVEGRAVRLLTVMPPKAAPNLALGTILSWDESLRTDFSAEAPRMAAATTQLPETVAGRLALPVDAEFNRVPLQEALDYIAGEMQVSVEIDGDALKDAGFTKNMAQTFDLGQVTAGEALAHLVGQYKEPGKEMVVVIDEPRKTIIVLTRKFADQQGLTVHDFGA